MNDKQGVPTPADFFSWLNQMMPSPNTTANSNSSNDVIKMWQKFAQQNQETYAKFWQQMSGSNSSDFTNNMNNPAAATASYRAMLKQAAKTYLEAADMPTRDDIIHLGEQISGLNVRFDDLGEDLNGTLGKLPDLLSKIATTLENLSTRLERLESKMDK